MVFCRPSLLVLWLGTVTGCSSEQLFLNRVMHPWTRGKLQFLQLQHGRGSIVRTTLHSIWSSAAVNVMRCTRDPSRLSRASPHTRVPQGPVPQHPKSPPGQHPSHFQMTPGRRALFHRQRTGIHHPTSKDRPKKLPAPGSRLASSFQLPFVFPSRPLLYSLHSRLCLHTAKRHRREAFGCRQLAVVSNRG